MLVAAVIVSQFNVH